MVGNLDGAKGVLYDVLLSEPHSTDPGADLALADDFVNIARAENLAPAVLRGVDLAGIAHEARDEAWALATGTHTRVERRIADDAWVHGDIALLRRALFNLLDNAIKYSPAGAVVEIALARDGARLGRADPPAGDHLACLAMTWSLILS